MDGYGDTIDGLKKSDLQNARELVVLNNQLEQQVNRAKECEIPCGEIEERCLLMKRQLEKVLKTYGPYFPAVQ